MTDHKVYKNLIIVNSSHGDWTGLYLDNQLWHENHSISQHDWAEIINNHHLDTVTIKEVDGQWLEELGSFPRLFTEIPTDKFTH